MELVKWLSGKKTYILSTALAVILALGAQGVIDLATKGWTTAVIILSALTGYAATAHVTKSGSNR